jgi:hypothetical protein
MNTGQEETRRNVVANKIYELVVARSKRKGAGIKRLNGKAARDSVLNGAAWRLMKIDAVLPKNIRQRLKPKTFGNIELRSIDSMVWLSWVLTQRYYIELGNFWFEENEGIYGLVDRALDAERNAYIRAGKKADHEAREDIGFYLENAGVDVKVDGQRLLPANSVTDTIERQDADAERELAETEAELARGIDAAKEYALMWQAIREYDETLLRPAYRKALALIVNEPQLTTSDIVAKVALRSVKGIAPDTVRKIRDKFYSLTDRFFELMHPEDALDALVRKVETLEKEMDVTRAERRRDELLRKHTVEEYEDIRAWAALFYRELGQNVDDILARTISGPKPKI